MSTIRPNSKSRNLLAYALLMAAMPHVSRGPLVERPITPRLPPKPQSAPEELSARQTKRQAKLSRRAAKSKQYHVRYIGKQFSELLNQTAIALDNNSAYLKCQFDDVTLLIANGDPDKVEHHWGFSWHEIPRKDLQRLASDDYSGLEARALALA